MFTFWVKVMDSIILQILWIGYIIYESLRPEKDIERSDTPYESQNLSQDNSKNKRHFIHLYTTTSTSGKPVCYMDVYQMNSKSEELKLRSVCSKGVPNQTYFKHKEQLTPENSYISEEWKNYSIVAI